MKNTIKLIIALVAVIGFTMTACDNNSTSSDGGSIAPNTEGRLTIINIPSDYYGKYIGGGSNDEVDGYRLFAVADVLDESAPWVLGEIGYDGKATIRVWRVDNSGNLSNYTGTNTNVDFMLEIYNKEKVGESDSSINKINSISVSFTSGKQMNLDTTGKW
jgi:hypothetical protein